MLKRSLVLRDRSGGSIELTLWGATATGIGEELYGLVQQGARPVFAIKSARVGDFNGKTLSTIGSSIIRVEPAIPGASELRAW